MFQKSVSSTVPRRAFLFMPLTLAGLLSVYSRTRRPDLPFRDEVGVGDEVTIAVFRPDGERTSTIRVRKLVKTEAEWKHALSAQEFAVARQKGTERAFTGRYWKNHDHGVYQCVCCGITCSGRKKSLTQGPAGRAFGLRLRTPMCSSPRIILYWWNALRSSALDAMPTSDMCLMMGLLPPAYDTA